MKILGLEAIEKKDDYIYYIHHYNAIAKIQIMANVISFPVSFTVEMNPLGICTVDLDPLPKDLDYPVLPMTKTLKSYIDVMARDGTLPQT